MEVNGHGLAASAVNTINSTYLPARYPRVAAGSGRWLNTYSGGPLEQFAGSRASPLFPAVVRRLRLRLRRPRLREAVAEHRPRHHRQTRAHPALRFSPARAGSARTETGSRRGTRRVVAEPHRLRRPRHPREVRARRFSLIRPGSAMATATGCRPVRRQHHPRRRQAARAQRFDRLGTGSV